MDFKTRHSNDFHAYDMAAARKYYEDYHYTKSNGQNGYGFYKAVTGIGLTPLVFGCPMSTLHDTEKWLPS